MKNSGFKPIRQTTLDNDAPAVTIRPPFDPEEFARNSESDIRVQTQPPPSARPTAPAPPGTPRETPVTTSGTMQSLTAMAANMVPALAIAREDLEWFELPAFGRELLALVDGCTPLPELCERAKVPLEHAIAMCKDLARDGVITLGG